MPGRKIYVNESLLHEKYQLFKSLKHIALGLGFKCVWHAGGRFLARRKGGEHTHVFASAADVQAILTVCQLAPNKDLPTPDATHDTSTDKDNDRRKDATVRDSPRAGAICNLAASS